MKKKFVMALFVAMSIGVSAAGCGKKQTKTVSVPKPIEVETVADIVSEEQTRKDEETVVEDTHEGEAKSPLTGEWVDEDIAKQRPVTCMLGNTTSALPQYGLGEAQVIYEAPVEGALTRLMGVFQDYRSLKQLGSVRSCRLYYAYYSMEFDAVYLHYGQASYATSFLQSGQIDDLNGLEYAVDSAVIYRDKSKKAPHNAYATGEGLVAGVKLKGYETAYASDFTGPFQFAEDDAKITRNEATLQDAGVVKPGYQINKPWFVYNSKDGLYYRYQYGGRQVDGTTNEQLAVKNILIANANVRTLDDKGYLEIDTTGEGGGWYVTDGRAQEITWRREDNFSPTHYFDGNGNEITMNQGKTWVCIVDNAHLDRIQFYRDESQLQ